VKFRTTLVLLAVFTVLLAAVLLFESKGKKEAAANDKVNVLVDLAPADVRKIELKRTDGTIVLEKDDKGVWQITAPLVAKADAAEAEGLVSSLAGLRLERVVETGAKDLKAYGIPGSEVSLWVKGREAPVKVLIGMENPLDKSLFAKRQDDPRVVLLSASLKTTLDKTVFDLRDKAVFKFEASEVQKVRVRAKNTAWEAVRDADGWHFTSPFRALAVKGKLDTLLESLSNLRATEFVAEDKKPEEARKLGLEKPEYQVALSMTAAGKEIVLSLHKDAARSYASSTDSTKIVAFDGALLADLEKTAGELRERKVLDFSSWEADRIAVKKSGFALAAAKEKTKDEDRWLLETPAKDAADGTKVEAFIRKVEALEAASFIDGPKSLAEFGLDRPAAEVRVRTKDYDNKVKEVVLLVGKEDKDKKQVVVKSAKLEYLFRVDASFLDDFPKEVKDWKAAPVKIDEALDKKK
jgi:hypothetical protein